MHYFGEENYTKLIYYTNRDCLQTDKLSGYEKVLFQLAFELVHLKCEAQVIESFYCLLQLLIPNSAHTLVVFAWKFENINMAEWDFLEAHTSNC